MTLPHRDTAQRTIGEAALWVLGAALLLFGIVSACRSMLAQQEGRQLLQSLPAASSDAPAVSVVRPQGGVEAELEIPSVGLSTPVLTGCTDATLRRGACRIEGTAVAGGLGNMAVAGHRDTRFRPLERLHVGAVVTVTDRTGRYVYTVNRLEVVTPSDVRVLDVGDRPELTLITCFPFRYVGAAPKRFIAHASLQFVDGSAS